jgi:TRAP-type C4-dicarboxylate transport system substrate-binding protein
MSPNLPRRRALITLAGTAAGLCMPAVRAAGPSKLKFTSFEPPMAAITSRVLTPLAADISANSGGTVQIDMFAGGTLGRNPLQQLKLVTDGVADLGWIVLPYTPGRFDDTDIVGLPFLCNNSLEASVALNRLYAQGALVGFDGLKMLAVAATPPVVIHANQPVRLPGDLKGKRVRVSGDHITQVIEALGGAPVQVGGGQIAEAMSRGVVDMTLNNWGFVGDFKINEVSSHHFEVPLGAVAVGVVMKQDRYDALPQPARAAIDRFSGEVLARKIGTVFDEIEKTVRDRVAKSGRNTVVAPSAAEVAEWKRMIEPVNERWRTAKPRNQRVHAAFVEQLTALRRTG